VNEIILVDTGFWIALYDGREEHHEAVNGVAELIDELHLVFPWPTLDEVLRTRFVRRPEWVAALNQRLTGPRVTFIDDAPYCDEAYRLTVEHSTRFRRDISMVDMLCRLLIDDPNVRIDCLFTVNARDFFDVCATNGVEILPELGS
jgi:predicted nucleic acid-binding protein